MGNEPADHGYVAVEDLGLGTVCDRPIERAHRFRVWAKVAESSNFGPFHGYERVTRDAAEPEATFN